MVHDKTAELAHSGQLQVWHIFSSRWVCLNVALKRDAMFLLLCLVVVSGFSRCDNLGTMYAVCLRIRLLQISDFGLTYVSQMTEEVRSRLLPQEEAEHSNLRTSVTGLIEESETCDAPPAPSQQSQPPLSFMAFSTPQGDDGSVSSSQLASVWLPGLHHPSEAPMTLQFGLLPGTPLLQASVPAIQIGSIQMPLHVPPHNGLQQVPHSASSAPVIQFGQLAHPPSLIQSTSTLGQSVSEASVSTQVQAQDAEPDSNSKVGL